MKEINERLDRTDKNIKEKTDIKDKIGAPINESNVN